MCSPLRAANMTKIVLECRYDATSSYSISLSVVLFISFLSEQLHYYGNSNVMHPTYSMDKMLPKSLSHLSL